MVRNTSSGEGLPTCQIWKAYLEWQKSYSPDTICCGCRGRFDLEVKIQGQRSPTMVRGTSSGGGLPTCQIWKSLSWTTKKLQPGHDLYDLLRTHRPVWPWGQRSPTMVHDTSSGGGLPTCQIWKACLERQKSYSPDTICYGRTDGGTDRMITIGALITFHCAWDLHRMPLIDWNPACLCILYIQENHMVVLPDCNSDDIKSYSQRNCLYRLLLSGNEWVSDCCLTPSKHDLIFIVLAHWNNIPWVEMSLRLVILSWFRANQSLCSYSLTLHA